MTLSLEDFIVAVFDSLIEKITVKNKTVGIMDLPSDMALGIALEARELSRPKVPPSLIGQLTEETEGLGDGE